MIRARVAVAIAAFALVGCGPEVVDSSGSPREDSVLPPDPGRYAVQWTGYVAGFVGEPIYAQLAFIDVGGSGAPPQLNGLELISDDGPVAAVVEAITPASAEGLPDPGRPAMHSALVRVDGLEEGRLAWNRIRYTDEGGVEREVRVGDWLFDIRPPQPEGLVEMESSVGSTSFGVLETVLDNALAQAVEIHGLAPLELPGIETSFQMHARAGAAATAEASEAPIPAEDVVPVHRVALPPGETSRLVFQIEQNSAGDLDFAVIRPLLVYRVAGTERDRFFGLSMQVYARPFTGSQGLSAYVASVPPDGYHPLTRR